MLYVLMADLINILPVHSCKLISTTQLSFKVVYGELIPLFIEWILNPHYSLMEKF